MNKGRALTLVTLGVAAGIGCCESPSVPKPLPTVMVTNPSCVGGTCRTIEVRLFDWNLTIPQPYWGFKSVGEVDGPTGCLTFPGTWRFSVVGPTDSTGKVDTTVFTLSANDPIFLAAMDSAIFHTDTIPPYTAIRGHTNTFTAASAPGWKATFSGDSTGTTIMRDVACGP